MDDGTKRKLDDQLTKIAREFKYANLSSPPVKSDNGLFIKECAENPSLKTSAVEDSTIGNDGQFVKNSMSAPAECRPQEATEEVFCDVKLEVSDRDALAWLESKQNSLFFSEEYGVNLLRQEAPSSDVERKTEPLDPLCFRVSMATSETCDRDEAQWFVKQASNSLRGIALEGVFVKCFWYEGPVPPDSNGSPDISSVVKKIKGHDGKNLDRIQDRTGVIIGVVLDNKGSPVAQPDANASSHRIIGVRIRCIRRRGICEASKKVQRLLGLAADFFLKEMRKEAREKNVVSSDLMYCSPMPPISATAERNFTAIAHGQCSTVVSLPPPLYSEKLDGEVTDEYVNRKLLDSTASRACRMGPNSVSLSTTRELRFKNFSEESDNEVLFEPRSRSNLLYVHELPGNMPTWILKSIFQSVLCEKLVLPPTCAIVVHAGYVPDQSCAVVQFATHRLLTAALHLYENDETVFDGLKVSLPQASIPKPERLNTSYEMATENDGQIGFSRGDQRYIQRDLFEHRSRYKPEHNSIKHNQSCNGASPGWDYIGDQPKPLFLTGLIKNASAQSIGLLFEDIINQFIGPPYGSSSGRQSVLDVRYVHSKKCAFVDLATPELVEIMLDLHSQKPELFCYMKMEIGNRDIPDRIENDISPSRFPTKCREDEEWSRADWLRYDLSPSQHNELGRADWLQHDIHPGRLPGKYRGHMRINNNIESSGAYRFQDRDVKRARCFDFTEKSDEYYFGKAFDLRKRLKFDHGKTAFAYRVSTDTPRENIN